MKRNILITGANGYVGSQIIKEISSNKFLSEESIGHVVGLDLFVPKDIYPSVIYKQIDICDLEALKEIFTEYDINTIIHLAAVLAPSDKVPVNKMYKINVVGTQNLIACAQEFSIERFICASSGAAYGYHEDNSSWLREDQDPIRGNKEFPYSYHKRINEEDLLKLKKKNPEIKQFIFRIGTVLGKNVDNLITDLFKKKVIIGVKGSETPFVFIWDEDLVNIFVQAISSKKPGTYNVAGTGSVNLDQMAKLLNKSFLPLPSFLIENMLKVLKWLKLSQYGPEQVKFLKFRPVLENSKLIDFFEYKPKKTSLEVFHFYLENRKFK